MDRRLFIDATALERKPFRFETGIQPGLLDLIDGWSLAGPAQVDGRAELLDKEGLRTIRVKGRLQAKAIHACDRCLKDLQRDFDAGFELYFYPMEIIEQGGETAITHEQTEVGFYEDGGIGLAQVVQEQLLLWLPARYLCDPDCKGICPTCKADRNAEPCDCRDAFADPRWDGLRHLNYKH